MELAFRALGANSVFGGRRLTLEERASRAIGNILAGCNRLGILVRLERAVRAIFADPVRSRTRLSNNVGSNIALCDSFTTAVACLSRGHRFKHPPCTLGHILALTATAQRRTVRHFKLSRPASWLLGAVGLVVAVARDERLVFTERAFPWCITGLGSRVPVPGGASDVVCARSDTVLRVCHVGSSRACFAGVLPTVGVGLVEETTPARWLAQALGVVVRHQRGERPGSTFPAVTTLA